MPKNNTGLVEPDITINGTELSFAEAMLVRVAVSSFLLYVSDRQNAAELGHALANGYRAHATSVVSMLHGNPVQKDPRD